MSHYAFWLLETEELNPLVVLAQASDGPWVRELGPVDLPETPIQFFCVRPGTYGPTLYPAGLVLFREDLVAALSEHVPGSFSAYPAAIRPPQSSESVLGYSVVKITHCTLMAGLSTPAEHPMLSVVSEAPDSAVVSQELRALLEPIAIRGLVFSEPEFVGGPSAV